MIVLGPKTPKVFEIRINTFPELMGYFLLRNLYKLILLLKSGGEKGYIIYMEFWNALHIKKSRYKLMDKLNARPIKTPKGQ